MNWKALVLPLAGLVMFVLAWRAYGWVGIAFVAGGLVMWMLMHFSRMMRVLQRAADRPVGWCDSAVMLNAKLKRGDSLLHVMAMTRALGEPLSPTDEQPEIFRWTDGTDSHVTCTFRHGRLVEWTLLRPPEPPEAPPVK